MIRKTEQSHWVEIYGSGPLAEAEQICRQDVFETPCCVTVTPTRFIYTGGEETGFVVGLVNYPRFPTTPEELWARATKLAMKLMTGLHQHSILVQSEYHAEWISRREQE